MKALTLKQPLATLVAEGYKKYEFRTWKTKYCGEIYIHAGKGIDKEALNRVKCLNLEYPQSKILAKVNISDCIELTKEINKSIIKENPLIYGNKEDRTGYAWKITKVEKIKNENIVSGKLRLWNYNEKNQ